MTNCFKGVKVHVEYVQNVELTRNTFESIAMFFVQSIEELAKE